MSEDVNIEKQVIKGSPCLLKKLMAGDGPEKAAGKLASVQDESIECSSVKSSFRIMRKVMEDVFQQK